jgi:copper chaperone CopZ
MQRLELQVSDMDGRRSAGDLGNVLTGLSGVARVAVDAASGQVTIDYDPDFTNPHLLAANVKQSGYLVGEMDGTA